MAFAQRGEAKPTPLVGVFLAADPEETNIEKPDGAGKHAIAAKSPRGEVVYDRATQAGQRITEFEHPVELLPIAMAAPGVVVAVLLAPSGVNAGGLEMAPRVRTDPHVAPSRGNG